MKINKESMPSYMFLTMILIYLLQVWKVCVHHSLSENKFQANGVQGSLWPPFKFQH